MDFFGSNKRKTFRQVKAHLVAKNAFSARAGPVMLLHPLGHNSP